MLALQSGGYLQQLIGWQLNDLLFSRSGIVLVMTFNIFRWFTLPSPQPAGRRATAGDGRPGPWRQRTARLLARDAADDLPGAGVGDAAGVYSPSRSLASRRRWAVGRE